MIKTYEELIKIPDFIDRLNYLTTNSIVGKETFGSKRYLNQLLYRTPEWKALRNRVIIRDNACDLAHPDYDLGSAAAYVHHINPITIDDILEMRPCVTDMNNLITCSFDTHQAIHYGDLSKRELYETKERKPFDTCPWRS